MKQSELLHIQKGIREIVTNSSAGSSFTSVFALLGESFQCERFFFFEKAVDGSYSCTEEWFDEKKTYSKKENMQNLTWEMVRMYYNHFFKGQNIQFKDIEEIRYSDPNLYIVLKTQGVHSAIVGQLEYQGEDLGFFGVDNPGLQDFEELAVLMEVFGYYTAAMLHSKQLIHKLEEIGYQDRLTEVGNRHALFERVDNLERGEKIAAIYFDVTNLRQVNRSQGHRSGDELLISVSKILKSIFLSNVFRLGGDEFLALTEKLPEERVQKHIRDAQERFRQEDFKVAVGYSFQEAYQGDFSVLAAEADREMYQDKKRYMYKGVNAGHGAYAGNSYDELVEIDAQNDFYRVLYSSFIVDEDSREGKFYERIRVLEKLVHPLDQQAFRDFWNIGALLQRLRHTKGERNIVKRFRIAMKDGGWRYIEYSIVMFGNSENPPILMCFSRKMEEEEILRKKLRKRVESRDFVLQQDTHFFHEIDEWVKEEKPKYIFTIACDLNNFKLYNDIFGREAGDRYLRLFYRGLVEAVKPYHGFVGYFGGDNFCVVLAWDEYNEKNIREKIETAIRGMDFQEGFLPCVGIYVSHNQEEFEAYRYDYAMTALSNIRGSYTTRVSFYDELGYKKLRYQQELLMDANRALQEGEFMPYFQPKVEMKSGKIIGAEALVRWKHAGKVLSPMYFIDAMEKNGYILAVDRFIWEECCKWLNRIAGQGLTPLPISVNVSRVDNYFMDVAEYFEYLVEKYAVKPEWLEIEVTESAYVANDGKLNQSLKRLRAKGFKILMDDFGSGYSSLNMLQNAEIDVLKLDQKFLRTEQTEKNYHIIESVMNMANLICMDVIAEGVETEEHRQLLLNLGCKYCQGFYHYRPMEISEFEALVYLEKKHETEL